jgi:hypothetical protein
MRSNPNLVALKLGHNMLQAQGVRDLFKVLRENSNLTFLDLSANKINDSSFTGTEPFETMLKVK